MAAARALIAASAVALAISACATGESGSSAPTSAPSTPGVTSPTLPVAERGALLDSRAVAPDERVARMGASATWIRYRSTSGLDGAGVDVTGMVFAPRGAAPEGGRPIVTVGHGTTGVSDDCAPSAHPDLLGNIGLVVPLLQRGFVVVVSDLQGLGTEGPHPYLEPTSAGYNLIDAVRATRALAPATSDRWAALGLSQGGQASWSAAELAGQYGEGLQFVGSANLSPAVDLSPVVPASGPVELTQTQQVLYPMLLAGLQVLHPDMDEDAYLHGRLAADKEILLACTGPDASRKIGVAMRLRPEDSQPSTDADRERMRGWLEDLALPKQPAAGPMLVVVGTADNLILPEWTRGAVARACGLGDLVDFESRSGDGHASSGAIAHGVTWLVDRFAGVPAPNDCPEISANVPTQ
ncbi:MAG: lipase [Aldersonia sp.]|nr:lipase [Aldersonia sp.]